MVTTHIWNTQGDGDPWTSTKVSEVQDRLGKLTDVALCKGSPASYVIFTHGSLICVLNGSTGKIDYSSADDVSSVQYALDNLTSGRTWKEKIALKGALSFSDTALVPNYTDVEVIGSVTLTNGVDKALFRNQHWGTTTTDHDIEIHGGLIDGNKANNAEANDGAISLRGVYDVSVHDLKVKDFNGFAGIYIAPYGTAQPHARTLIHDINAQGCTGTGSYGAAVYITGEGSDLTIVHGITSYDNRVGVFIEDLVRCMVLDDVTVLDATRAGVWIDSGNNVIASNINVIAETKNVARYMEINESDNIQVHGFIGKGISTFGAEYDGINVYSATSKTNIQLYGCDISNVGKTANDNAIRFSNITHGTVYGGKLVGAVGVAFEGTCDTMRLVYPDLSDSAAPISGVATNSLLQYTYAYPATVFKIDYQPENLATPGTTYMPTSSNNRVRIDFDRLKANYVRLCVSAAGDDSGTVKGLALYDITGGSTKLCEYLWDGATPVYGELGSWSPISLTGERILQTYVKGSSGTETIYTKNTFVEFS